MIYLERAMGFEPTTFSLATRHSTTELRPLISVGYFSILCLFCKQDTAVKLKPLYALYGLKFRERSFSFESFYF